MRKYHTINKPIPMTNIWFVEVGGGTLEHSGYVTL